MRIVFSIIALVAAWFFGFFAAFYSQDNFPNIMGQNTALTYAVLINLLWLVPYLFSYIKKNNKKEIKKSLVIFLVAVLPFVCIRFYITPFNEHEWKTELDNSYQYGDKLANANGSMAQDIIDSKVLIGLSREKVIEKMGDQFHTRKDEAYKNDLFYFYTGGALFDPCSQLHVKFENGICVLVEYCDCG